MIIEGRMHFDPQDGIYTDHFPGHAVVPGSMIIQGFIRALGREKIPTLDLSGFRFKRFISPGTYRYTLSKKDHEIRCTLYDSDRAVVTGKVMR